ncbi:hypothetical protein [Kitasatospora sp. MAP5-34]|uniref:hypothetical protein n=1 Tax=Kitasatospora sp. MAP5-34 TaxID=3035102 RepID=UPI00247476A2|nr:hypothetical protein [Kitasatospora sp. MAP5-34]MDH6574501.1 hypothetical protein [Kitasatospora sp. MAP5-34]
MSDMHERFTDKAERDAEDVRAADPEEGITSYQTVHAGDHPAAEGAPYEDKQEDSAK